MGKRRLPGREKVKILGIETSSKIGGLALVEDGEVAAEGNIDTHLSHSAYLIPQLDSLLEKAGWKIGDLEGIGVGLGPGSFTGLRVGLAVAQGIAFAREIPLAGVSSFETLVRGATSSTGDVRPIMDARRGRVYLARYRKEGDEFVRTLSPRLIPLEEAGSERRTAWFVSPHWEILKPLLEEAAGGGGEIRGETAFPKASWTARLALRKLREEPAGEMETVKPVYLSDYWTELRNGKQ